MPDENLQKNINKIIDPNLPGGAGAPYNGRLKTLRTYQGDVSEAIKKNQSSVVSIAVAEQDRRTKTETFPESKPREEYPDHSARNKFFIFGGTIIFLLGLASIAVFYYIYLSKNTAINVAKNETILNYDEQAKISLTGSAKNDILEKISAERTNFALPANSILNIDILDNGAAVDSKTFMQFISPNIPQAFLRNLSGKYMLGVYSFDKNQPFLILTVDDYGIGFSGMLEWEKSIVSDLGQIFGIPSANGSGGGLFVDESLNNRDLRVLKGGNGQTVFLYSFLDKNTVIITANENIFNALLQKFLTAQANR